jgi:hypothetical protein
MRGPDEQTADIFSYVSPETRVRADHPLRAIRQMTDQVLRELSPRFERMYSDLGRPSIPPEQLLRALLLQGLCRIRSERLLIEEIDYSILFRWFIGLSSPIWGTCCSTTAMGWWPRSHPINTRSKISQQARCNMPKKFSEWRSYRTTMRR